MNWLLMGPVLSLAIKAAKAALPMLMDKMFPGLKDTLAQEVSPEMKALIGKGLSLARDFVESTPTNLDNYLVEGATELADSLGLLAPELAES